MFGGGGATPKAAIYVDGVQVEPKPLESERREPHRPIESPLREALVRRLLEHQKFKAAAELLHERETLRSAQWTRPDGPIAEIAGEAPEPEVEVDLFSLISAFRNVVERAKQRPKVYLPSEQIPIEDRIEQLMARLSETEACGFEDLFSDDEYHFGKTGTDCIEKRVIHDGFAIRSESINLFYSAIAASDAGSKY